MIRYVIALLALIGLVNCGSAEPKPLFATWGDGADVVGLETGNFHARFQGLYKIDGLTCACATTVLGGETGGTFTADRCSGPKECKNVRYDFAYVRKGPGEIAFCLPGRGCRAYY